jgi:hypothetical protein
VQRISELIPLIRWHVYALRSGNQKHIVESGNQLDRWLAEWDEQEEVRAGSYAERMLNPTIFSPKPPESAV